MRVGGHRVRSAHRPVERQQCSSSSMMSPSAVNILVTEPMRKSVSAVTARLVSRSITPKPPTQRTFSRDTIATPTPGIACSRRVASILSRSGCRSSSAWAASGDTKIHRVTSESQRMQRLRYSVNSMEWASVGRGPVAKVASARADLSTKSDSTPNRRMSGGARSSGLSFAAARIQTQQALGVGSNPRRESTSTPGLYPWRTLPLKRQAPHGACTNAAAGKPLIRTQATRAARSGCDIAASRVWARRSCRTSA